MRGRPVLNEAAIREVEEGEPGGDLRRSYDVSQSGVFSFTNAGLQVTRRGVVGPLGADGAAGEGRVGSIDELDLRDSPCIGGGSSGKVFVATHLPTGRRLAVKRIPVDEDRARREILKELETLYVDASRFIVSYHGAFYHEGSVLIALEQMDASLLDTVRLLGSVPEDACRAIAWYVSQGLIYLHTERRKIHRDIKPSNLLLGREGVVKITDFGVSTGALSTANFQADTFVGTVTYMSPERLAGKPHSYSADVYSLGLTLVELVTGRHPFLAFASDGRAVNYWDLFQKVEQHDESLLDPGRDGVSADMASFCAGCLSKDPARRPSAVELMAHPWLLGMHDAEAAAAVRPIAERVSAARPPCGAPPERAEERQAKQQTAESMIDDMLADI